MSGRTDGHLAHRVVPASLPVSAPPQPTTLWRCLDCGSGPARFPDLTHRR